MHYTSYLEFRMWIFTYDPSGAHPIGRGYPLIIPHIIEVILVSAVIWIVRGNSNIDISMIIL